MAGAKGAGKPRVAATVPAYDFRGVAPSWERRLLPFGRAEARALGCSEAAVAYLFVNPKTESAMKHPEDWFWTDPEWFRHAKEGVADELFAIAGGCFKRLSVPNQAALLGIPFREVTGTKAVGERGKWRMPSGAVGSVEELAFELSRKPGDRGTFDEGLRLVSLSTLVRTAFERMHGHWIGFDPTNKKRFEPSEPYTDKVMAALRVVLADVEAEHARDPRYHAGLWGRCTIGEVVSHVGMLGRAYVERLWHHGWSHGRQSFHGGHPDVTIVGSAPRFVEAKANDRMHANQASWIKDVARPLGLDVSVLRVKGA